MGTVKAIVEFLNKTLEMIDKRIEDPARRKATRMEAKQIALDLVTKITKEVDPDEADKMLAEYISLTSDL